MDPLTGFLTVMAGLTIRFGIPIVVTAVLVWLLRKLDARWQREAQRGARIEPGPKELFPLLRCWVLNDCPEERKRNCKAYLEAKRPCWQVFRDKSGHMQGTCLECDVLRNAPIPAKA